MHCINCQIVKVLHEYWQNDLLFYEYIDLTVYLDYEILVFLKIEIQPQE